MKYARGVELTAAVSYVKACITRVVNPYMYSTKVIDLYI